MTVEVLLSASGLVFVVASALVAAVLSFDRFAPERLVQERHDLALGASFLVPILFALSLRPERNNPTVLAEAHGLPAATPEIISAAPQSVSATTLLSESATSLGVFPWDATLLTVWCVISLGLLFRLGRDLYAVLKLKTTARAILQPQTLSLSKPIVIKQSAEITSPMLVGYFSPTILLPDDHDTAITSRGILEHEVAHAVRGDVWTTLALHILNAVFWWLLPLRLLTPIINRSREMLCDSYAAEMTRAPFDLAKALLDTATETRKACVPTLIVSAAGSDVPTRVRRLTTLQNWRKRQTWATLTTLLPVLVLVTYVATPRLGEAQAQAQEDNRVRNIWIDNNEDADLALYRAAYHGRIDEIHQLIASGEDPSAISLGDGTPLIAAIRRRHEAVLDILLEAGADPNTAAQGDGTALITAARTGQLSMAKKLLKAGANPNLDVHGDGNPLIAAAHYGEVPMIDLLLGAGADPNAAVPGDGNALISAALMGRLAVAQRLLAAGADPNGYVYKDETPLITAAQQGRVKMVNLLIAAGADISLTVETPRHDPGGPYRSPLSEAERNGHDVVVRRLRELGAEHRPQKQD